MFGRLMQASARLTCPGPGIAPDKALRRIADHRSIVMLSGAGGWTHLFWDAPAQPVASCEALNQLMPLSERAASLKREAWSDFVGGWFLQLDYEFPAVPGTAWKVGAVVSWDPAGRCRLSARSDADIERMRRELEGPERDCVAPKLRGELTPAWNAEEYAKRVAAIRAYIEAGDIYQANLTMPLEGTVTTTAHGDVALWTRLGQDAAYGAFIRHGGRTFMSLSPECFLRIDGRSIASEPIKGTRRRKADDGPHVAQELLASAKNRAELAMIVDLMRNDLGRVARPGTVAVVDGARIMELPYVHHLVGEVTADLRADAGFGDVISAAFPPGSITGAPKIRAMQIIRELEHGPRGAYCGAFGWINDWGQAQLAVAIRTVVLEGNRVLAQAGSGVVGDSTAASEWDEVLAKASPVAAAFGVKL